MDTPEVETPPQKVSFLKYIFALLIIISLPLIYLTYWTLVPLNRGAETVIVEIKKGENTHTLAKRLEEEGFISSSLCYRIAAKIIPGGEKVKAGEYQLSSSFSPADIIAKISKGKVYLHQVTIPEGYNIYEIADTLEQKGLTTRNTFIATVNDKAFIESLQLGKLESLEGYLFPSTYLFRKGSSDKEIAKKMVNTFKELAYDLIVENSANVGLTPNQVVNLASVVEKETSLEEERPLVASVFHNRLKIGMRLQSDPTVIYGIKNYDGNIRKKDLMQDTPYNTYRRGGLPKGPIANPGLEAIKAVLNPASTDYLYFVATKKGGHYFSTNIKDHNRAVRKYQLNQK